MLFKCMEILDAGGGQRDYRFSLRVPESSEALFKLGKTYELADLQHITWDEAQPVLLRAAEMERIALARQQSPQDGASESGDNTKRQTVSDEDPDKRAPSPKAGKE